MTLLGGAVFGIWDALGNVSAVAEAETIPNLVPPNGQPLVSTTPEVKSAASLTPLSSGANPSNKSGGNAQTSALPAPIRVALYDGAGAGRGLEHLTRELQHARDFEVQRLGAKEIETGALDRFDVVLFPGGSSTRQGQTLGPVGRQRVQQFVRRGGGYVGICAGAYLATTESLRLIGAKPVTHRWKRGRGIVTMELTEAGRKILGTNQTQFEVRYHNGPILTPVCCDSLPDYQPLAVFRTEVAEGDAAKGVMIGSPAALAGSCGKGRVLCFSPHPDQTKGQEDLVRHAVRWTAQREKTNKETDIRSVSTR